MNALDVANRIEGILTAGNGGKASQDSPMSMLLVMFALIALSFYFIYLRPMKKEQAARKRLLDDMKKGDNVVSIGGIHGTIQEVDKEGDTVTVEVAKNVRIKFLKSAVSTIVSKDKS